jgi:hypothetical protein
MKLGVNFMNLAGSVLGDMASTATLMKDAGILGISPAHCLQRSELHSTSCYLLIMRWLRYPPSAHLPVKEQVE